MKVAIPEMLMQAPESPKQCCYYKSVWLEFSNCFSTFFLTKRSSLPSKLDKPLWSMTTCMYKHTFCLSSIKCWFCSLVPIVKCEHGRQYDLACLSLVNNTKTQGCIVGNGHILQWDLMSKINILRSWDKKVCLCIHVVVILTCMLCLDGKLICFVTKKWKKRLPNLIQTDYRVVSGSKKYDHITPVLKDLHWLPIRKGLSSRLCFWLSNACKDVPLYTWGNC